MVVVQHLLPQKARILLMLALTRTKDPREIQRIFNGTDGQRLSRVRPADRGYRRGRGRCCRVRPVAARLERGHRLDDLPADRPRWSPPPRGCGWPSSPRSRRCCVFNYFFLPPVGTFDDRRSAELGRAVRVPRRQPRRQQPVGGGARADAGGARPPRRTGAPVRPEPRRPGR